MKITKLGSVRVDLLGGTLDLNPINLILENVVTLNVATSLKAKVELERTEKEGIEVVSLDYKSSYYFPKKEFTLEKLRGDYFGPMAFVCQILDEFDLHSHLKVTLQSGSPAGAGLGGSSAMGVTLYGAICDYKEKRVDISEAIQVVNSIEARILDSGPAGYQDYYPAMYGGVLALHPTIAGVSVEQLFSTKLKSCLEKRVTLIYSGQTRLSGINNWEVYKNFFDKLPATREGLRKIAELGFRAYESIIAEDWNELIRLIGLEGAARRELFPGILSSAMASIHNSIIQELPHVGIKVCGAGGGGCFLLTHQEGEREFITKAVSEAGMSILPFEVEYPLPQGEVLL
jgi:D-glycero-alpha-D-manno-heptose-7-phosphate kinase